MEIVGVRAAFFFFRDTNIIDWCMCRSDWGEWGSKKLEEREEGEVEVILSSSLVGGSLVEIGILICLNE
jgi:hypothetical protein